MKLSRRRTGGDPGDQSRVVRMQLARAGSYSVEVIAAIERRGKSKGKENESFGMGTFSVPIHLIMNFGEQRSG